MINQNVKGTETFTLSISLLLTIQNTRKLRKLERKPAEYFWPDSNVDIAWENTEQQGGND